MRRRIEDAAVKAAMGTSPPRVQDPTYLDMRACVWLIATVVVPSALTLRTIQVPRTLIEIKAEPAAGPSPLGYAFGFLAVLMTYIWCDEYWLERYNYTHDQYRRGAKAIPRVVQFYWPAPAIGVGLIAAAAAYKRWLSGVPEGWPGYFAFLAVAA